MLLTVLSLGAGVQSSTLALMAAHGEITPMPDCAIFADTQAEPAYVYTWLDWLEKQLPYPVHRVTAGDLRQKILDSCGPEGNGFAPAPFYNLGDGKERMMRRQCTREFKVTPITKKIRELAGLKPRQHAAKGAPLVIQYIGISLDEAHRQKPSREHYIQHRWPLVEAGIRRLDCERWMAEHDYPQPRKSACTFCPYHDDKTWIDMKANDPESWADAVRVDETIRAGASGMEDRTAMYVHQSLKPLSEVDFSGLENQVDMFGEECEGMCGV